MKIIRIFWRLFLLAVFTTWKTGQALLPMLTRGYDLAHALRTRREWAEKICRYVGIRANYVGKIPDYPCLLLANHRSYLDPILILGATEAFPVAKAEVRKWPVLGAGAAATGVIFLNRGSAKSRGDTMIAIADQLKKGHRVILFPEGTTGGLETTIPFKKGSFQIAAKYNLPIVPIAINYWDKCDYWLENETFLHHFFRTFGEKTKRVDIIFGERLTSNDANQLMCDTRDWIDLTLLKKSARAITVDFK